MVGSRPDAGGLALAASLGITTAVVDPRAYADRAAFDAWAVDYRARLCVEGVDDALRKRAMNSVNPKFVLRNHLAEIAIQAARGGDEQVRLTGDGTGRCTGEPTDFGEVRRLLRLLSVGAAWAKAATAWSRG